MKLQTVAITIRVTNYFLPLSPGTFLCSHVTRRHKVKSRAEKCHVYERGNKNKQPRTGDVIRETNSDHLDGLFHSECFVSPPVELIIDIELNSFRLMTAIALNPIKNSLRKSLWAGVRERRKIFIVQKQQSAEIIERHDRHQFFNSKKRS